MVTELEIIIFCPMRIYPPYFGLQAEFQNFKCYFHPLNFFEVLIITVEVRYLLSLVSFYIYWDRVGIWHCLWYYIVNACLYIITLTCIMQRKPLVMWWQTDRQIDFISSEIYFLFNIDNWYALLWAPNAYHNMSVCIFTACLFFPMHFKQFSMCNSFYAPYL